MTTYAQFVAALVAMPVTGISRVYPSPPDIESSSNYPFMFPRLPEGSNELVSLDSTPGLNVMHCDLVVTVDRDSLNVSPEKFRRTVELMDNLNAALKAEMNLNHLIQSWEIESSSDLYGWVIIARVEALG